MNRDKSSFRKYFHFISIILFAVIVLNGCTALDLVQSKKKVKEMFKMNKNFSRKDIIQLSLNLKCWEYHTI